MTRVDIHTDARDLYRAYLALDRATAASPLDDALAVLVKVRASMINGCAYCVEAHSQSALELGEPHRKLLALSAWHESPLFSDAERAALQFTDAVTNLRDIDDAYAVAAEHFESAELTALLYTIVTVNGWNRLAIATHMVHD
jgi:AhpD family alkylhydroperoxidase